METMKGIRKLGLLIGGIVLLCMGVVVFLKNKSKEDVVVVRSGFESVTAYPQVQTQSLFEDEKEVIASLIAPLGVSGKQVLEYYKSEFGSEGWKIVEENENDILAEDGEGNMYRVWIYFSGGDGEAVIYNVDYVLAGNEMLPIPVQ